MELAPLSRAMHERSRSNVGGRPMAWRAYCVVRYPANVVSCARFGDFGAVSSKAARLPGR